MAQAKLATVMVVMGSRSDWPTMKHAILALEKLGIECEPAVISAHRTPKRLFDFAAGAKLAGVKVIIAGAGGAAHLPGMLASLTSLPVIGVPVESKSLKGMDSLLSIAQMPSGVPVAAMPISSPENKCAANAGLYAARILALSDSEVAQRLHMQIADQTASVPETVED